MQYIPPLRIAYANSRTRPLAKNKERLADTVIATLQTENEIKTIVTKLNQEIPVTAQDIRKIFVGDEYTIKMKDVLENKQSKNINLSCFSICDDVLMNAQSVAVSATLGKCIFQ